MESVCLKLVKKREGGGVKEEASRMNVVRAWLLWCSQCWCDGRERVGGARDRQRDFKGVVNKDARRIVVVESHISRDGIHWD